MAPAPHAGSQLSTPCNLTPGPASHPGWGETLGLPLPLERVSPPILSHGGGGSYPLHSMQSMINYRVSH